jgi:hypothetical protein
MGVLRPARRGSERSPRPGRKDRPAPDRGRREPATTIEIAPTGPLPGDYFVGTESGRFVGLVRLDQDYDEVGELDLVQMVQWTRDVSSFPRIAVVATEAGRRLEIVGGGLPARVEVEPVAEPALKAAWP